MNPQILVSSTRSTLAQAQVAEARWTFLAGVLSLALGAALWASLPRELAAEKPHGRALAARPAPAAPAAGKQLAQVAKFAPGGVTPGKPASR